ncbi:MAG: inorganic diphosphatase [Gemmatimonadetes bacterium]|nr:inorganic diphosphatase [Gemmatimonadota bacterium]
MTSLFDRATFREDGELNVIIEAPKGSRNKYAYDPDEELFVLKSVLPAGAIFPFDFGFIPSTLGEDGDPVDVLVLMDEPAFPGCLVPARLVGGIEAEQTERDGATMRNDRLIAVAAKSYTHRDVRSLDDLNANLIGEIEHFFASYNQIRGKRFETVGRVGADGALQRVKEAIARASQRKGAKS